MRSVMPWALGLGLLLAPLVGAVSIGETQAPAVAPQSLVGEWVGSWQGKHTTKWRGQWNMTIVKVEGRRVFGHVLIDGRQRGERREFDFVGSLEGNRLSWGKHSELTVSGDEMRGTSFNREVTVTKGK